MDTDLLKKLDPLFHQYRKLYYKKGQIILQPDDKIDHIYFIEKGYVRFYHITEEGKELTFLIYKPGYLFPILYAFFATKTRYYFEALTPLVLRRAPRELFTELISESNFLLLSISQEFILRMQELLSRMETLTLGKAYQNVALIILTCAEQLGKKKGNSFVLSFPLAHKDIASMAGLTRETVSTEMKKLEREGLISYKRKNITIKNVVKFKHKTGIELNYDYASK